jgi:arylsulfatase
LQTYFTMVYECPVGLRFYVLLMPAMWQVQKRFPTLFFSTYEMVVMSRQPNILFILADDMGYSDIGCFGAEIRTPVLDGLAARGVRFTQGYNCARCCPSRASLMTGLYPHKAGVGAMVGDDGHPGYRGFIRPDRPTIAERLRDAGYRTWMSGKWHCGGNYMVHKPEQWRAAGDATHPLPSQRGFDRFYGTLTGAGSYFDPPTLWDQDRLIRPSELPADYYLTDELGRRAAGFIEAGASSGNPFFGYLAFTAPHWPLHAPEADIAPYRGAYREGWDVLRARRLDRLVAGGLLPPGQALSERDPEAPAWEDAESKEWHAELMAVYAAQVAAMDRAIGVAIEALRRTGQLDNTLIVFLSDNGGCAEFLREDGETGKWPEYYNLPTKSGTRCVVGNNRSRRPGPAETFMSYELAWANASNTPFRKFKAWTHEGGISTPLIACWPTGLPAGAIRHAPAHLVDLVATACGLGGASTEGLDGVDLLPTARGECAEPVRAEPLCWEHYGHAAIRDGAWKLVRAGHQQPWELYDIDADRIEQRDRASGRPEVVARLAAAWQRWADRCGVQPQVGA